VDIIVSTVLPPDRVYLSLEMVSRTLKSHPHLMYRPRRSLQRAYEGGRLAFGLIDSDVAGWILAIDHTQATQELAGLFVLERYRGSGMVHHLSRHMLDRKQHSIASTGNPLVAAYLARDLRFSPCSFANALRLTGGKLLIDRLDPRRARNYYAYLQHAGSMFLRSTRDE